jgi:HSP20 family protein
MKCLNRNELGDWIDPFFNSLLTPIINDIRADHPHHFTEEDDNYFVELEVPRFKSEDLSIKYLDRIVTVSGELGNKDDDDLSRHRSSVKKSFRVPRDASEEGLSAKLGYGVLKISIPKSKESKAVEVKIMT